MPTAVLFTSAKVGLVKLASSTALKGSRSTTSQDRWVRIQARGGSASWGSPPGVLPGARLPRRP